MSPRAVQVSVIGAAEGEAELLREAERVGRAIAEAGAVLVCGGHSGVMGAASRGAAEGDGTVIGVLPGLSPGEANEHVTYSIATGVGHARNLAVVASGDAVIAVGGEWGTLSEIAYARKLGRPVVALRSWPLRNRAGTDLGIAEAETAEEAVRIALSGAGSNERVVSQFYEAINGTRMDEALAPLDPEVRWHRPPDVPITGTVEGAERVRKMWTAFTGALERFEIEPSGFEAAGDRVLARITMRGAGPDGEGSFEFAGAQVFRLDGSRIAEVREFRSLPEARLALD